MPVPLVTERLSKVDYGLLQRLGRNFLQPIILRFELRQPFDEVEIRYFVLTDKCQGIVVYEPATTAGTVDQQTLGGVRP